METWFSLLLSLCLNKTDFFLKILISLRAFINHLPLTYITIIQSLLISIINHTEITHAIILKSMDMNIDILIRVLILLVL